MLMQKYGRRVDWARGSDEREVTSDEWWEKLREGEWAKGGKAAGF